LTVQGLEPAQFEGLLVESDGVVVVVAVVGFWRKLELGVMTSPCTYEEREIKIEPIRP
jgi:hypothetical protein